MNYNHGNILKQPPFWPKFYRCSLISNFSTPELRVLFWAWCYKNRGSRSKLSHHDENVDVRNMKISLGGVVFEMKEVYRTLWSLSDFNRLCSKICIDAFQRIYVLVFGLPFISHCYSEIFKLRYNPPPPSLSTAHLCRKNTPTSRIIPAFMNMIALQSNHVSDIYLFNLHGMLWYARVMRSIFFVLQPIPFNNS